MIHFTKLCRNLIKLVPSSSNRIFIRLIIVFYICTVTFNYNNNVKKTGFTSIQYPEVLSLGPYIHKQQLFTILVM